MTTTRFTYRAARGEIEKRKAIKVFAEPGSDLAKAFGGGWLYLIVTTEQV